MFEPIISFRLNGIMCYNVSLFKRSNLLASNRFNLNASKLVGRKRYKGIMSTGARRRLKKAVTMLLQSTPTTWQVHPVSGKTFQHHVSFVTLTIPESEKSKDAKSCHKLLLEPMLRVLRRRYGMKSYIWKCELQTNGSVHYHLTSDLLINHTKLKEEWNAILLRSGFLSKFINEYGHSNPNSTDIHKVWKINNMEAYLLKYIAKEYQNETALNAKIWDCSKNLKIADYFKIHIDTGIANFIRECQNSLLCSTKFMEKAVYIDFKTSDYYSYFGSKIVNEFANYLRMVRDGTIADLYANWKTTINKQVCQLIKIQSSSQITNYNTKSCPKSLGWNQMRMVLQ